MKFYKLTLPAILLTITACGGGSDGETNREVTSTSPSQDQVKLTLPNYAVLDINSQNASQITHSTYALLQHLASEFKDQTNEIAVHEIINPTTYTLIRNETTSGTIDCDRSGTWSLFYKGKLYENENGTTKITAPGSLGNTFNACGANFLREGIFTSGGFLIDIITGSHGGFGWPEVNTKIKTDYNNFYQYRAANKEVLTYQQGQLITHFKNIDDLQFTYQHYYEKHSDTWTGNTIEYMLHDFDAALTLISGSYSFDKIYRINTDSPFTIGIKEWGGSVTANMLTPFSVDDNNDFLVGEILLTGNTSQLKITLAASQGLILYELDADKDGIFELSDSIALKE